MRKGEKRAGGGSDAESRPLDSLMPEQDRNVSTMAKRQQNSGGFSQNALDNFTLCLDFENQVVNKVMKAQK